MTERFADPGNRYRLEERLATGGMGEVWWATDTVLDRNVAVKLLKPEYADNPEFRTRFTTEARHAAALHHPGVAAVFDFGDDPARPAYIVMELVDGQPLDRLLRPGVPMPSAVARDLVSQAAEALAAAHSAGIVHRDVKPGNLLVTGERDVKVTDFGIARATEAVPVTQTGQIVGTPQYISPEQATGGKATAASDVYGLGVVLYECLAGRRPFVADNPVAIALAHVREPVPPLPDSVPPDLAAVTMRALDKDPERRYADAAAFAAALQALASPDAAAAAAAAAFTQPAVPSGGPEHRTTMLAPGDAVPAGATAGEAGDPTEHGRGRRTAWLATVPLLLAVGTVIWLLGVGQDPSEVAASDPPTPRTSQTPTAQKVQLDPEDYVGRPVDRVAADLRDPELEPVTGLVEGDTVTVRFWGEPPPPPAPEPDPAPAPDGGKDGGRDGAPGKSGPGGPGKGDNKGGPDKGRPGKGKGR